MGGDETRRDRLAEALRANLRRRKEQARGRREAGSTGDGSGYRFDLADDRSEDGTDAGGGGIGDADGGGGGD